MATLYGVARSRASRTLWLAAELGLTLDHRPVIQAYRLDDPQAPDAPMNTASEDFLAISPAGAVPVLVDDGFVLTESLAINLYLARKYGGALAPSTPSEDAEALQWALFGVTSIEPPALAIQQVQMRGAAATDDGADEIAGHAARLARPLRRLNQHLATAGQMIGARFTVADINMAEIVRYTQGEPELLAAFPAVRGWLAACQERPAFQAMWRARQDEPA